VIPELCGVLDLAFDSEVRLDILTRVGAQTILHRLNDDLSVDTLLTGDIGDSLAADRANRRLLVSSDSNGDSFFDSILLVNEQTGESSTLVQEVARDLGPATVRQTECGDFKDNDNDGLIDLILDPGCLDYRDPSEKPECSDGLDSDGNGLADLADSSCSDGSDPTEGSDAELDGIPDWRDNCTLVANGPDLPGASTPNDQVDTDRDDYGNPCDCDFDQDELCGIGDFTLFLADFATGQDSGIGSDMNADGIVGLPDFSLFLVGFQAGIPGPSAFHSGGSAQSQQGGSSGGLSPSVAAGARSTFPADGDLNDDGRVDEQDLKLFMQGL
jgi:hypothetical protein